VVTGRCEQKLRDITDEEIARCGLDGRQHFSTHWNQGMTLGGSNSMWSDNPRVLRFEFELVRKPLPKIDNRKPKYLHKKRGPKPRSTRTIAHRGSSRPSLSIFQSLAELKASFQKTHAQTASLEIRRSHRRNRGKASSASPHPGIWSERAIAVARVWRSAANTIHLNRRPPND